MLLWRTLPTVKIKQLEQYIYNNLGILSYSLALRHFLDSFLVSGKDQGAIPWLPYSMTNTIMLSNLNSSSNLYSSPLNNFHGPRSCTTMRLTLA